MFNGALRLVVEVQHTSYIMQDSNGQIIDRTSMMGLEKRHAAMFSSYHLNVCFKMDFLH